MSGTPTTTTLVRTGVLHRPYITLALYYTSPILHQHYITLALSYIGPILHRHYFTPVCITLVRITLVCITLVHITPVHITTVYITPVYSLKVRRWCQTLFAKDKFTTISLSLDCGEAGVWACPRVVLCCRVTPIDASSPTRPSRMETC